MSIVALREIRKDEEILVSYNYVLVHSPQWYKELWFTHLRDDLEWSRSQIEQWCETETAKWGYRIKYLLQNV